MINGIVIINKNSGYSSHQVVQRIRRMLPGIKAGHSGTLDPLATGVLPVCLGKATRLVEYIIELPKTYKVILTLGKSTATGDAEGPVIREGPVPELNNALLDELAISYTGIQEQLPPLYSAVKYKGKPLYRWVREGIAVPRQPRMIEIYRLEIQGYRDGLEPQLAIEVECSKGTYMRTLAIDIGDALGCGAYINTLTRLRVGPFAIEQAVTSDEFNSLVAQNRCHSVIEPLDSVLYNLQALTLPGGSIRALQYGQKVVLDDSGKEPTLPEGTMVRIYDQSGIFTAIGSIIAENGSLKVRTVKFLAD